jgi:ASC-1-like (ASCH) protein
VSSISNIVEAQDLMGLTKTSDPLVEPLSFLSAELTDIATAIQTIETRYFDMLQTAVAELRETAHEEIKAEQQRLFDGQLQEGLRIVRDQLEERFRTATQEWQTEKEELKAEVESLRRYSNLEDVLKEISQTEAVIGELKKEIDSAIDDPSVELSKIIQKNSQLEELRAYARGLSFRTELGQNVAPDIPQKDT